MKIKIKNSINSEKKKKKIHFIIFYSFLLCNIIVINITIQSHYSKMLISDNY